jgi:hypothetical protein
VAEQTATKANERDKNARILMDEHVRDEGGRGFKSCHSDQYLAENKKLTGTDCGAV